MATSTQRQTTSRKGSTRASSNGRGSSSSAQNAAKRTAAKRSSGSKNGAGARTGSASAPKSGASRSASKRASTGASRAKAKARTRGRAASANGNGSGPAAAARERAGDAVAPAVNGVRGTASDVVKHVGASIATGTIGAAAGIAGGILIGRTAGKRPRKVLGVKLPGQQRGLSDVASGISEAGKQFGKLAGEVRTAREKAEDIGKALR